MSVTNDYSYEKLGIILEKQYGQTFTFEEVREIGNDLVDFYILIVQLSEDINITD